MSSLYAFRCWTPAFPRLKSTLVIFSGPSTPDLNDITTAITLENRDSLAPEAVVMLFPADVVGQVSVSLRGNASVLAALAENTQVGLYSYDAAGCVSLHTSLQQAAIDELPLEHIRRQGLTILFRRRGGLLESGPTAHFVKLSQRIDVRFLRASHALAEGAEIFFTAFWLLPFTDDDVRYIHVDTSSISSVAMALLILRKQNSIPIMRTFNSYEGLDSHPFSVDRKDLVLISASQSGGMASKLVSKVADPKKVVTLFSTSTGRAAGSVLCDLNLHSEFNAEGYAPSKDRPNAKLTRPIRIIGEHFIAEPHPAHAVVPGIQEAPPLVRNVLSNLQGHGVFRSYRGSPQDTEPRALWIDVQALTKAEFFKNWVRRSVCPRIPMTTKMFVFFENDPGSSLFLDCILDEINFQAGTQLPSVRKSLADVEAGKADWSVGSSPVVIVGGATGHGADLLAASRALRTYAPDSHRVFLTTAAMPSSVQALKLLASNLRQPSHDFFCMLELSIDRRSLTESWTYERDLLTRYQDELEPSLVKRLEVLDRTSVGLDSDLFITGSNVALRDNFAFWPNVKDCSKANQADVFATIASILHNMRCGDIPDRSKRLVNDVQNQTVISAETFSRYNDGLIQAAFLRAALPIELNYASSPEQSRLMSTLITQMAELVERPQGEAVGEFLLAIATERMVLADEDIRRLLKKLESLLARLNAYQRWLVMRISDVVGRS